LYFYGELEGRERHEIAQHVRGCDACRQALEELAVIREALASRPDVCAPAGGDWTAFMARLDAAVQRERRQQEAAAIVAFAPARSARPSYAGYLAMAALLALVTMSVLFTARTREAFAPGTEPSVALARDAARPEPDPALATMSEQHFERSKLVVLDLATRDVREPASLGRERDLAAALLNDTRLYRMAAEERRMTRLADVLRDLELVLLQTSMTQAEDPGALARIQRLIRKRDLIGQMESVSASTTGS
jgi:hypothetical protein